MAEKDITEKLLEDYEDVFADIANVLLFDGKEEIEPDNLIEAGTRSMYKAESGKMHQQERDVVKKWIKGNINIAMIGIENQTKPEKYMTARVLGYDGASYRSQFIKYDEKKNDKKRENNKNRKSPKTDIAPVLTFVLYYGKEHWNYKTNLKGELKIPDELDKYVNDYKINVFEISYLTEEQISRFKSDFKIVANFFVQRRIDPNYVPNDPTEFKHVDAVLKLLSVMSGDDRYYEIEGKKEVKNMCEVADRLEKRGIEKGLEQGEDRLGRLIVLLTEAGRTDDVIKASTSKDAREELYKEFNV